MEQLRLSIENSSEYPQNLVRTEEFPHSLRRYHTDVTSMESKIFSPSDPSSRVVNVVIWDLESAQNGPGYVCTETKVTGFNDLQPLIGTSKPDPRKRFFFLRSKNSRSPLNCSRSQLQTILSSHQVMASFLDHVISFQRREEPHKLARFTNEDYLSSCHALPGLNSLHRSGFQIQHCFNVLGMEYEEYDDSKWKQRQVAVHHAFDLQNGRSTWIVMKGDDTIRKRMQEATRASLTQSPEFPALLASSLHESLKDHLITLQWGAENWGQYINSLEDEYDGVSKVIKFDRFDDFTVDDTFAERINARRGSTMSKAALAQMPNSMSQIAKKETTKSSENTSTLPSPGLLRRLASRFTTQTGSTFPPIKRLSSRIPDSTEVVNEVDLAPVFKFDSPERLNRLANSIRAATSVIDQNKRVFSDIISRYQELTESPLFDLHVSNETTRRLCMEHVADFTRKIQRLENSLERRQAHMKTILYRTEQAGEMYDRFFKIRLIRTTEHIITTSQNSTELMQEWTEQMHQKTMSMHIITIFTMIFLPGTFVATMFSSGIVTFGEEGEGGFGPYLGDWKVRPAGIKLFFAICVPLLFITLCAWMIAYYSNKVKASTRRMHIAAAYDVA